MKAKICSNRLKLGGKAVDYLRLVEKTHRATAQEAAEPKRAEAQTILETFQEEPEELDIGIAGKQVIQQLDSDFDDMGLVPYYFSKAAKAAGENIAVGHFVIVPGLTGRRFRVLRILRQYESIRLIEVGTEIQYLFPWTMVRPMRKER
ncbi:MAG: hypothetical protein WBG50_28645 [Desulfomonilaceae bacterium]